jgi:uncharacterized membrane protein YgcG
MVTSMDTLGEDLLLLLIGPQDGLINNVRRINFGLAGSEVVRLAACGRIDIVRDEIVVRDQAPTGDPLLDLALGGIVATGIRPLAATWVGSPRAEIRRQYLDLLAAAGVIHGQPHERAVLVPATRWTIIDRGRLADARGRLDVISQSAGPLDQDQAAFGGLAFAVGLDRLLYPGWSNRKRRKRLAEIAKGSVLATAAGAAVPVARLRTDRPEPEIVPLVEAAGPPPGHHHPGHAPGPAAPPAPVPTATDAAMRAAADAATRAATDAATQAATHAATHAAVQAATHAAVSAAHHAADAASGGHGGGGHSGHGGGGTDFGGGGHHH